MTRTREENASDLAHEEEVRNRNHPVCAVCGSDDILFDAYVQWDRGLQDWSVTMVTDDGHVCENCGHEVKVKWTGDEEARNEKYAEGN